MLKYITILLLLPLCFGFSPTLNSFNAGVLTPFMEPRTDFQKYQASCRTVENMFVTVQGPAVRRPGTYWVADTKDNLEARIAPFEYSTDDTYILEFTNGKLRFYRDSE